MSFDDLRKRIADFTSKQCGKGANEKEISVAEAALRVTFPYSYRQFLREYGWASLAHMQLYGLGPDVPLYLELVKNTVIERNAMHPSLPCHLIPIMNDGAGNHYCLDTGRMHDLECPVVFWDHESPECQCPDAVSERFDSWLATVLIDLAKANDS